MRIANLSDEELVRRLTAVIGASRRLLARLIVLLIEVEERRIDLRSACSSLYDYCQRRLGLSESEAVRRIEAARLVRRFPALLGPIERGDLHLTALLLLRDHFRDDNVDELAAAAKGKTKRELQALVAARTPKPDVPTTIRPLTEGSASSGGAAPSAAPASATAQGRLAGAPREAASPPSFRLEPLSMDRYRLEVTIGAAVCAKIDRARELMSHALRRAELEPVLDRALDLLLAKLEKERFGTSVAGSVPPEGTRPAAQRSIAGPPPDPACVPPGEEPARSSSPLLARRRRHIPRAVRREVFLRDGERCTFSDERGERCATRTHLQLDHIVPFAAGGSDDVHNLRVRCRAHNRLSAEQFFGRARVDAHLRQRRGGSWRMPAEGEAVRAADDIRVRVGRALVHLGFPSSEAQRAIRAIEHAGRVSGPLDQVLRAALATLA